MTNIIDIYFDSVGSTATAPSKLWQWSKGQIVRINGIDLPTVYQVHFSNNPTLGTAEPVAVSGNMVSIPDIYLTTGEPVYLFIWLSDETSAETIRKGTIYVAKRSQPSGEYDPTAEQQTIIDGLIGSINTAVDTAEGYADSAQTYSGNAATSATEALNAKDAAQGYAEQASQTAQGVEILVNRAEDAADDAETAKQDVEQLKQAVEGLADDAESAKTDAETARGEAQGFAQTATTKASEAGQSASQASQSATIATEQAQTATDKAAEASQSAETATTKASEASASATTATTKASEASASASTATTAKNDAVTAKNAAVTAKTGAETARTGAEAAAQSVSASAAQIATNTSDIADLKEDFNDLNVLTRTANEPVSNNRLNPATAIVNKGVIAYNGLLTDLTNWNASDYIMLRPGDTMTCGRISWSYVAFYDINKNFVDLRTNTDVFETTTKLRESFVVPEGVYYIRVTFQAIVASNAKVSVRPAYDAFTTVNEFYNKVPYQINLIADQIFSYMTGNLPARLFEPGGYSAVGNNDQYLETQRARTIAPVQFPYDVVLTGLNGTQIDVMSLTENDTFDSFSGWSTSTTIKRGERVKFVIWAPTDGSTAEIVQSVAVHADTEDSVKYTQPLSSNIEFICRDGRVSNDYPPDSYYAIRATANNEYDRIRFSVTKTTDGQYICVHDTTINNLAVNQDGTAITEAISTKTQSLAQLNQYDWGLKWGSKYAGMTVPMLADCLHYANMFGLPVALDFKWTLTDEDITAIHNLLVKYNHLNAILVQITIPTMQVFAGLSKFYSYYFSGTVAQINSQAGSLKPLMNGYNKIYVQPTGTQDAQPTDEQIAAVAEHGFVMYVTPIEGLTNLIARGFDRSIGVYECHYLSDIKTTVRRYMNNLHI